MKNEKQQLELMAAVGNFLAEHLEQNRPVTIAFRPYRLWFDIEGTNNKGMMQLTHHGPDQVRLQLGVVKKGSDRLYSNYLPAAAAEDMIPCLRSSESHQTWLKQIEHLSSKADE